MLAKIPAPDGELIPGVKGISLFIVPKYLVNGDGSLGERNDVVLAGLNHKMGYRGTTNCLLNFGEGMKYRPDGKAGAIGYLVRRAAQGLGLHVPHDERGPHRRRARRGDAGLHRLPACAGLRAQPSAGPAGRPRRQGLRRARR